MGHAFNTIWQAHYKICYAEKDWFPFNLLKDLNEVWRAILNPNTYVVMTQPHTTQMGWFGNGKVMANS